MLVSTFLKRALTYGLFSEIIQDLRLVVNERRKVNLKRDPDDQSSVGESPAKKRKPGKKESYASSIDSAHDDVCFMCGDGGGELLSTLHFQIIFFTANNI